MRSAVSTLALVLGVIGSTWGADLPTLDELAASIEQVRSGPDGERVVAGHISRKLGVSVEALRAQRARTALGWGDLFIASLLSRDAKLTVDSIAAEFKSGLKWEDIARRHNVGVAELVSEVRQSQQAMEQRAEDRAPPRTESAPSPGTSGRAPTSVVPVPRY